MATNKLVVSRNDGRDASIDLLKGIGILLVVIGHVDVLYPIKCFIYSFHMPLFAFVGGLFLRTEGVTLWNYSKHKAKKLLIPFYIWSLFFWVIYGVTILYSNPQIIAQHYKSLLYITAGSGQNSVLSLANVALWFLPFLFSISIVHYCVSQINNMLWQIVLCIIVALAGVSLAYTGTPLPYSVDTALTLYPFLWVGTKYRSAFIAQRISLYAKGNKGLLCISALVLIQLACTYFNEHFLGEAVDTASNKIGPPMLFYLGAFAAIGYTALICNKIKKIKLINYIGQNSLVFLIFHLPLLRLISTQLPSDWGAGWFSLITTVITVALCFPISYWINKHFGWSLGK